MFVDGKLKYNFEELKAKMSIDKFLRELEDVATSKEFNLWYGTQPMVIVVDEANALKSLKNQAVYLNNIRMLRHF